ncbi:MAG: FkbM family methyltransferase [Flavobacteriales bacterium]|jgi:FkbM family methyltransferase|nr:FkbM family methyltransferase [Flavobacteriales bacterium]
MRRGIFKGIQLSVFPEFHLHLIYRNIEPDFQKILKKNISEGDTVLDVGANIGYVSVALSKLVGDKGKVFSFEAIPHTSSEFIENISLNNCSNITLIQKALSNENKKVTFRIPDKGINHSMASMVWHKKEDNTINVEVDSIILDEDKDLKNLSPSFVKIDVEGSEGMVISGMKELISREKPIIYIECSDKGRETVWNTLKDLNYSCYFNSNNEEEVLEYERYRHNDFLWRVNS